MAGPLVSVILPFLNAEKTLPRAVGSIQAQDLPDWELLLFDDGSEDGSLAIAEACAAADGRIRVIGGAHVGIVEALRRACAAATGAYLARMDADDYAYPQRLSTQYALLAAQAAPALCGTRVRMTGEAIRLGRRRYAAWINGLRTPEELAREVFIECPLPHPTFMLPRGLYEAVGGYQDHGWPEDYDLVLRVWEAGYPLVKTAACLLDWEEHGARFSMRDARYAAASFRALKRACLRRAVLPRRAPLYQWGAGEVGKRWLREWGDSGPRAVVDIRPGKIGQSIHGYEVIAPKALPPAGAAFVLVAVGTPGARDLIREWMAGSGRREVEDYLFIA